MEAGGGRYRGPVHSTQGRGTSMMMNFYQGEETPKGKAGDPQSEGELKASTGTLLGLSQSAMSTLPALTCGRAPRLY